MKLLIITPANQVSNSGNRITANRYADLLREVGHQVSIANSTPNTHTERFDVLFALHAKRSADSIRRSRKLFPERPIVLVLTGTDLHRDLPNSRAAQESLQTADRIVLLEPHSLAMLPANIRDKTVAIFQSTVCIPNPPTPLKNIFEIVVVGHLRSVKDPFRTCLAAKRLPADSKIKVAHIGAALSTAMESRAQSYTKSIDRYTWLGPKSHLETKRRIARAQLLILTSKLEGGPSVIAEAIVNDTPVLSSRVSATIGMLGTTYPGFFDVGDTEGLSKLMSLAETDKIFYGRIRDACEKLKSRFSPAREVLAIKELIDGLGIEGHR